MAPAPFLLNLENQGFLDGTASLRDLKGDEDSKTTWILVGIVVVGLTASLCLVLWMLTEWFEWAMLAQQGVPAQATVTDFRVESGDGDSYYVTYTYQHIPADGDPDSYTNEEQVSHSTYTRLEQGMRVPIIYAPDMPEVATLDTNPAPPLLHTLFTGVWVLGFNGIPSYLLWQRMGQRTVASRLRKGCRKVLGEIVKCTGDMGEDDYTVTLQYRFRSPTSGKILRGKMTRTRNDLGRALLPDPGMPVMVLHRDDRTYMVL
jgi:hypothetical protein